ncbi:MAG: lamin tail domain-containing protein [Acidobacteriota bacterium]|nr:lamin tail domain-containing protein [Acidobacteriota bacterium]
MKTLTPFLLKMRVLFFLLLIVPAALAQHIEISQVYGGGGNSGAPYTNDFIELYNPTASAVSLSGWSVQYASAAGTTWTNKTNLSGTIPAYGYFLVAEASGSTGSALPTADVTGTINLSGTAGKVALVNSTTALTNAGASNGVLTGATCPTATTVVDFVGYGTTATCYEGTGAAPAPSNTTADIRNSSNTDTDVNSVDFTAVAPNPRNSSSTVQTGALTASGAATPSAIYAGDSTLLTGTVTPGTSPTSTGITVNADLSSIGGSSTQSFYDDGTNGDATAGNNVFSFSIAVPSSITGTKSIPVTVTDAQARTASTTIALTVNAPVAFHYIHEIQGTKSLTAQSISPYAGQTVKTSGIVTGVGSVGFFLQSKDADADASSLTPEGIYVYCGSGKVPTTAVLGNELQVTGTVATYPAATASHTPATELSSPTITLLTTGNTLPTAVDISGALTPTGGLYQLTPYEGMRVTIPSLTTISGTDGTLTEASWTTSSNGQFYAVITGTARPFREAGIDIRDTISGAPANAAQFDDNPERILVDSDFLGGTALNLTTGAVLANVTGVLDFTYSSDSYYDPSRLLLDSSYSSSNVTAGMAVQPVDAAADGQFTVAAFNVERFFNSNSSDNVYYNPPTSTTGTSSAVNISAAGYTTRLTKASLAIRNVLNMPDIVALEEIENQSVAADIAAKISTDAVAAGQTDPQYVAYGTGTTYAPYTNDVGGISVGFLVKSTKVSTDSATVTQYGASNTFTDPRDSSQATLNDRPPLVLHAGIKRSGTTDYPVTVIVNHLRSLSSVNDATSGAYVRLKKELQAEFLANLIQTFQTQGEHVISVGDYNVFEFSDGLTDVMATVTGQGCLSSTQVMQVGNCTLVSPAVTDLVTTLPAAKRQSYVEYGNAQVLDHIVVTSDLVSSASIEYAHLDSDFPITLYSDSTTPARSSDHDAAVSYFALPSEASAATLSSPTSGGTLSGTSTTFTWTANGSTTPVYLWVGTTTGAYDLVNIGPLSGTSTTVTLPTNGATVYATLWSTVSGNLVSSSATYTEATQTPATLTTPTSSSTLTGASTTFTWTANGSTTPVYLWVGTTTGAYDLVNIGPLDGTSTTVTLPTNGAPVYATLWSTVNGSLVSSAATYTEATLKPASITSPVSSSTLGGASTTFTWTANGSTTPVYLWVGTTTGAYDLVNIGPLNGTSTTVTLPTNGAPVYATLWSTVNGSLVSSTATYTQASVAPAALTSPAEGSQLSSTQTFTYAYNQSTDPVYLWVGSTAGAHDVVNVGPLTGGTVTVNLPTDGATVYLTLWSTVNGNLTAKSYTYMDPASVSSAISGASLRTNTTRSTVKR